MPSKALQKYERKAAIAHPESELDKIRLWYFQDATDLLDHDQRIVLTDTQEERKRRLERTWELLIENSKTTVRGIIKSEFHIQDRQAYNLINQAGELFGDVDQISKKTQRALRIAQREREIELIKDDERLTSAEKYDLVHKNLERIEKVAQLDKEDTLSMAEVLDRLKLPDVQRTSDPAVIDAVYEEMRDDQE